VTAASRHGPGTPAMFAVSDLHVAHAENRRFVADLRPRTPEDWLLIAGDTAERADDMTAVLRTLGSRFHTVVWAPGNHELWTPPSDPLQLRGERRYRHLVRVCRELGVVTPEDPYPVWRGAGGPVTVAPLHVLYDYTFRPAGTRTKQEGLARARAAGVLSADELVLHPDPYPSREAWCRARLEETERRLAARDSSLPTVLVNHFPLLREPTALLRRPELAQWCGTERTARWHLKYRAEAVVYGHLHIPRTTWHDGVRFEEVSLCYPRERRRYGDPRAPRQILPAPASSPGGPG
jgi:3',5'-cyclic AMP phosphodiesterase CpdA